MSDFKNLEHLLMEGRISRREFISRMSAMGLAAALSPALLPKRAEAAVPKKGGHFIIGLTGGSTTNSLDPATLSAAIDTTLNLTIRNALVEIDHNFNLIPELAESWDSSPDASVWKFNLRKGVEFHNGKTFTADDVIFTMNHHRDEASKSPIKALLKAVKEIKKDGDYAVIFTLDSGSADFPFVIAAIRLTMCQDGTKGPEFEKGIGTGGYMLEAWEPGVRALLKRNPNYWKEGRAHFDSAEMLAISDGNARTIALKTGRIHYMDRVDLKSVHFLKKMPNININALTGLSHIAIPMLLDRSPYNDNDVRMALKLAIDREALVKTILQGYGEVGNDHPIAPINRYHADNLEQRHYDPDKARYYIKKARMLDHVFNLHSADAVSMGAIDIAVMMKEHAKKAGIKINVIQEPNDGYWSNVWMKKEWCFCYWSGRPTEDLMFTVAYQTGAPWNDTHWSNKRFDELLIGARSELDTDKRRKMYAEMQEIVRNDSGTIVPLFYQNVEASSTKVTHGPIAANTGLDGLRIVERWWFV